jgi:hypothetical protein
MDEEMEDGEPRRRQKKKVVDPEPLDDYPGGPHQTDLLWRYHVHVARKATDGVVCTVKLTLYLKLPVYVLLNLTGLFIVKYVCEAMSLYSLY